MKKVKEEIVLVNIERNPLLLLASVALTAGFVYLTYASIFSKEAHEINPLGFFLFVPTIVIFFHTLWFLLNPFALVFDDKLEMKQSLFHNKLLHYIDIKKVGDMRKRDLHIVYNDDEIEKMSLFGIKPSHRALLKEELRKRIAEASARINAV